MAHAVHTPLAPMPALFPRWSNAAYLAVLGVGLVAASAAIGAPMIYIRTAYGTHQGEALEQPIQFDHRHHVRDDGIACLYCHPGAERERHAGIPPTSTCIGCHNQIWAQSELLSAVRESALQNTPIAWKRVHDLPDFVYFHHGVHVQNGVACATCHGKVEDMARVYRVSPLTMDWCLDCHRDPPSLRAPLRTLTSSADTPRGRALTELTTCTACHR